MEGGADWTETTRRDVAFQPARLLASTLCAGVGAVSYWLLGLTPVAGLLLLAGIAAFATQNLWLNPGGLVSRVRIIGDMVAIQDPTTPPGEARAVPFSRISRLQIYDVYMTIHLKAGGHDGVVIRRDAMPALAHAIETRL